MQLKDIAPSYGIAMIVAVSIWFFKYLPISNWAILPIQIVVGLIVFFSMCRVLKLEEYKEAKELIKPFVNKIRSK